jgi:hypothetical protein
MSSVPEHLTGYGIVALALVTVIGVVVSLNTTRQEGVRADSSGARSFWCPLTVAPFGVVDMLGRDEKDVVATSSPDLPGQVTHVWLMTSWAIGSGLRCSPTSLAAHPRGSALGGCAGRL